MASARARPRPAPSSERLEIEPPEASPRLLAPLGRDAGATVGDLDPDPPFARANANSDLTARGAVADRVFDRLLSACASS